MGSRMMPLIIASKAADRLTIRNRPLFLLGGIAPDGAFTRDKKNESHFYEGKVEDGTRIVNYDRFIDKYCSNLSNEYMLGYLTHLVSDDVWMKFIYFKHDMKQRLDEDPRLPDRWHNDFRKLNGRLVERFKCADLKEELIKASTPLTYQKLMVMTWKPLKRRH
ncbi:hypothetical protein EV207_115110 [Scopulibacillus darangshiensis]|uniref:Zinc dependent phospholipase C n=1 Tax=Scopulibacillus darangshiensis TaxID=442528 RepID=A0A4R2P2D4_9BACL|nr:zinc dependent phospholipase C family protein [Scopulibacillus darangshiensis]TCP28873.1 hypothetical protein EV207_115110 [Scopulibacillus darangshiensis]